ncbi:hypothetical protein HK098_001792 [Nowakowskiella sp. JEL0407]|nr:hypothetical protein HK098_001792 [Nowakowskiella sp. JEL0407]
MVGITAKIFEKLFKELDQSVKVLEMHSRLTQSRRDAVSREFRENKNMMMFTSDVSARGVDYPDVSLVIQLGMTSKEQYVHRTGRTGRAGSSGKSILVLSEFEEKFLESINHLPITDITDSFRLLSILKINYAQNNSSADAIKSLNQVIGNIKDDPDMKSAAEKSYAAFMGFYKSNLKHVKWSAADLINCANSYALDVLKLKELPGLTPKQVGMMGLKGESGIRIVKNREK